MIALRRSNETGLGRKSTAPSRRHSRPSRSVAPATTAMIGIPLACTTGCSRSERSVLVTAMSRMTTSGGQLWIWSSAALDPLTKRTS